jgi:glucosamine--fructose-6-phosphate aminotransferase (isomerizing)
MSVLIDELFQQPAALRGMVRYYQTNPDLIRFDGADRARRWVLTGMGASHHAAWVGALHLNDLGIPAIAVEAADLVHYARALQGGREWLVYISQSGSSGEVTPLLEQLEQDVNLIAMTNNPESELARQADRVLPLLGGDEQWIASKTYVNSIALLWLLARRVASVQGALAFDSLFNVANYIEAILQRADSTCGRLIEAFENHSPLLFVGHGPHAATAREAAMTLGEWPKVPALYAGVGAFRHGFIEAVHPGYGVTVFTAPGETRESALALARELDGYGARVLCIENGALREVNQEGEPAQALDEYLSPAVDIIPIQLMADSLAARLNVPPGFRYISKVVRKI